MKIQEACLPCLVSLGVRCAALIPAASRPAFYRAFFHTLANVDFDQPAPLAIGLLYRLIKQKAKTGDPYASLRKQVNTQVAAEIPALIRRIRSAADPFAEALRLAALANSFDFNPLHQPDFTQMLQDFQHVLLGSYSAFKETDTFRQDLIRAQTVLVLGDNFGEVMIDRLLLEQIRILNPKLQLYYAVRGCPVVNDVIAADARQAGIERWATIISSGDDTPGTLIARTGAEFQAVYRQAGVLISKGQANFECLIDQPDKNRYFLLKVKCAVLAERTGLPSGTLACIHAPVQL